MIEEEAARAAVVQDEPVPADSAPPQNMQVTVEAIRPVLVKKGSFRRSGRGRQVINSAARWIVRRLDKSGLTLEQWLAGGCSLSAIGVSRATALQELQPAIPDAHTWYNESGDGKQYATWSDYFAGSLSNRLYYFFHKHVGGKIVVAVAEWPGTVENGVLIAPGTEEEGVAA